MNKARKNNEPRRHHYIPQFIIKNFTDNELGFVKYYDIKRGKFLNMPTEEIFMYNDLYRDEINNPDDPTKIERDFAKFEGEISKLIKERFLSAKEIVLSDKEQDSLLLFLALMQIRSSKIVPFLKGNFSEADKELYSPYQENADLISLWKKNLGHLVKCRSIDEVLQNQNIDEPFKMFMLRDTFGLAGLHLVVAERRGKEDFFLSDAYPVIHTGETDDGLSMPIITYFPISPKRIIMTCVNFVELIKQEVRYFDSELLKPPVRTIDNNGCKIHVRKLYEKDVAFINDGIMKHTKEGIVLFDDDRFFVLDRDSQL